MPDTPQYAKPLGIATRLGCAHVMPEGHSCGWHVFDHIHNDGPCENGSDDRHHPFEEAQPHEHQFNRCICGALGSPTMPDTPAEVGDVLIASHVVTSAGESVPAGWTLVAHTEPRSPTMPDTLKRFTYKGYVDGDYVEDPEGEWMDADEVRAHIDALTAAVEALKRQGGSVTTCDAVLVILGASSDPLD